MVRITILGATGSIGQNTLEVIALHPGQFEVFALTAHRQVDLLFRQCLRFKPLYAVISDEKSAAQLQIKINDANLHTQVLVGEQGLCAVASAPEVDCVMAAMVGAVGLVPALAAVKAGKRVLLANKEVLIMAGALFMEAAQIYKAMLVPVDSEHNAILQCLPTDYKVGTSCPQVDKVTLTASGGAFRDWPLNKLAEVTPQQAIQHPNWVMGPKITVDCATMMNKGFEVVEAYWLFHLKIEQLAVVLHPQSIIHSFVTFEDGSTLAQLGQPDMRVPISYALTWPKRLISGVENIDWIKLNRLDFLEVDTVNRYPSLQLAFDALKMGHSATCVLNAANEVAVAAFLNGEIRFTDIYRINAEVLNNVASSGHVDLESLLALDAQVRRKAQEEVKSCLL